MKTLSNPVIPEEQRVVLKRHCVVCGKSIDGFYGRWGDTGTCSKKCEQVQEAKPKYERSEQ